MSKLSTPVRGRCALIAVTGLLLAAAVPAPAAADSRGDAEARYYTMCGHLGMPCLDEQDERARKAKRARAIKARRAKARRARRG